MAGAFVGVCEGVVAFHQFGGIGQVIRGLVTLLHHALPELAFLFCTTAESKSPAATPQAQVMVAQVATVLTESLKSMNNGTRGFYFAVAGLFLFAGPIVSIVMTLGLSVLLYYRQGLSTEALAIERYVNAMIEEGIEG